MILYYYFDNYVFNKSHHDKIVQNTGEGFGSICIFGEEITNKQCNKFDISIKWKKMFNIILYGIYYITNK